MLRSHAAGGMARARPTRRRLSGSEDLAVRRPLGWPEETPGGKLFCRCVCVCVTCSHGSWAHAGREPDQV